jgi:hypothetical protein
MERYTQQARVVTKTNLSVEIPKTYQLLCEWPQGKTSHLQLLLQLLNVLEQLEVLEAYFKVTIAGLAKEEICIDLLKV